MSLRPPRTSTKGRVSKYHKCGVSGILGTSGIATKLSTVKISFPTLRVVEASSRHWVDADSCRLAVCARLSWGHARDCLTHTMNKELMTLWCIFRRHDHRWQSAASRRMTTSRLTNQESGSRSAFPQNRPVTTEDIAV
jgi:hypothetical protein